MPRTMSLPMLQAQLAQHTSEVLIELIEIDHPDMDVPLRFCNDAQAIVSNGNTYSPHSFQAELPTDDEPRASIKISNVDLSIAIALDLLPSRPTATLSVVTLTDPDTAEYGPLTFSVYDQRGDAQNITLDLVLQDLDQEPYPRQSFTPQLFPGLF